MEKNETVRDLEIRLSERERIKRLIKTNWNNTHPNYKTKLSFIFALIDGVIY